MQEVEIAPVPIERFEALLDPPDYRRFVRSMERAAECFRGRTLWCVNSTPKGGGVAELLASIMGYVAGVGVHVRWLVIDSDDDFFAVTKRIHNRLHGEEGDAGPLGEDERTHYEACLRPEASELTKRVAAGDVVIVHDSQPAGLVPAGKGAGARVIWRCHVGVDDPNEVATATWDFLRPYVAEADACVFSRGAYAWSGLDRVEIVPPSIDAFSPKNQAMDRSVGAAILRTSGILSDGGAGEAEPRFHRLDGSEDVVRRAARMIEDRSVPSDAPVVTQVSRWDRLKDPAGVMEGFVRHVPADTQAHLILAGPRGDGVADDPEVEEVLGEVQRAWESLPPEPRERVHVACLPVEDDEENSAIVNALQRRAAVVVQKSLAEGFGLTVAEAMWKERPVVASRVGGIQDQIVHGVSGLLVDHPEDLEAFGRAVSELLVDGDRAGQIGQAARRRVCEEFLATRHLQQFADLLRRLP